MSIKQTITPRSENYAKWYQDIIAAAGLAEHASVKGFMIIKPYGYSLWENIQKVLDGKFKAEGVANAYFPLLMPESYIKREAQHIEGFSPELAVVTHAGGKKLEEPLVIRPTSEAIVNEAFARWIQSYRDLPLIINQWANVVRWEMRPRLFLRSTEFLWQEGHTAHATQHEAEAKTKEMLEVYRRFVEDYLAIAVVTGLKTESEKFAGAVETYSIETMAQDGKALQAGTSHFLGQNFAKAFDVKFSNDAGTEQYVWQTSWGVSTRLIGALILAHSDDKGLVLPPRIAPLSAIVVPVTDDQTVLALAEKITDELKESDLVVDIDKRDLRPGVKFFEWEKKGVPIRIELGPKEVAAGEIVVARRDNGAKISVKVSASVSQVKEILEDIQNSLFKKSQALMAEKTKNVEDWPALREAIQNGFARGGWCGARACEDRVKSELQGTIRCIPLEGGQKNGRCVVCGAPASVEVIYAKAY
jgi:prolyl-tRNA synthetase